MFDIGISGSDDMFDIGVSGNVDIRRTGSHCGG